MVVYSILCNFGFNFIWSLCIGGQHIPCVPLLMFFYIQLFLLSSWHEVNFFFGNISIFEYGLLSDTNETIIERWPPIIALVSDWPGKVILVIHWPSWMLSDLIFRLSRNMRELSSLDLDVCCREEPRDQVSQYYNESSPVLMRKMNLLYLMNLK